ncbi:hypothetical protein CDAR_204971 [Caerostris darwini]|uniref:Uncharacterized protein n=1 Tax=Caerostris darwini TaxID=1538125 RepID=A0AAV4SRL4_9ARAC|nr:hypothetical protein CDAR_204971 [Caerostris darwini]
MDESSKVSPKTLLSFTGNPLTLSRDKKRSKENPSITPSNSNQKFHAYSATVSRTVNPFNSKGPKTRLLVGTSYFTRSLNPLMARRLARKKLELDAHKEGILF